MIIQWLLPSQTNKDLSLPISFTRVNSYVGVTTINISGAGSPAAGVAQIHKVSESTIYIRVRANGENFGDACHCILIGY